MAKNSPVQNTTLP